MVCALNGRADLHDLNISCRVDLLPEFVDRTSATELLNLFNLGSKGITCALSILLYIFKATLIFPYGIIYVSKNLLESTVQILAVIVFWVLRKDWECLLPNITCFCYKVFLILFCYHVERIEHSFE